VASRCSGVPRTAFGNSHSADEEDVVVLEASRRVRVRSPKTLSAAYPGQDHKADEVWRQLLTQVECVQSVRGEWQKAATQREKREVS
jgi:hypothetical protein